MATDTFTSKHLPLCSTEGRDSHKSGRSEGWVNYRFLFVLLFWWITPQTVLYLDHLTPQTQALLFKSFILYICKTITHHVSPMLRIKTSCDLALEAYNTTPAINQLPGWIQVKLLFFFFVLQMTRTPFSFTGHRINSSCVNTFISNTVRWYSLLPLTV